MVPEGVAVVPCEVDVVPGVVDVVVDGLVAEGLVCPMPGLGVTVPVVCAEAMPIDNANTNDANKILRIEPAPSLALRSGFSAAEKILRFKSS